MHFNSVLAVLQFASAELSSVPLYVTERAVCSDLKHRVRALRFYNYASQYPLLCAVSPRFYNYASQYPLLCAVSPRFFLSCCAIRCCVCVASWCYELFGVFYCDMLCLIVVCYVSCVLCFIVLR